MEGGGGGVGVGALNRWMDGHIRFCVYCMLKLDIRK